MKKFIPLFLLTQSLLILGAKPAEALPQSCLLFGESGISFESPGKVKAYKVQFQSCEVDGQKLMGIRQFRAHRSDYLLLVNPENLQTSLIKKSCLRCESITTLVGKSETKPNSEVNKLLEESKYSQALNLSGAAPFPMSDDGITRSPRNEGLFLSVDLCPSHHGLDERIFDNTKVKTRHQFPVAISVSGGWIEKHESELHWLKNKAYDKSLDVVWVNHSLTHPYHPSEPEKKNFFLTPGINFDHEVLGQEELMIQNGITPSVFFRFPGLISNREMVLQLKKYGLATLGSDAWLALLEKPKPGSLILIHGNGNERFGVDLFLKLLEETKDSAIFRTLTDMI